MILDLKTQRRKTKTLEVASFSQDRLDNLRIEHFSEVLLDQRNLSDNAKVVMLDVILCNSFGFTVLRLCMYIRTKPDYVCLGELMILDLRMAG